MHDFLNKYFLLDGLGILQVQKDKDKVKFQRRMLLLEEALYLTNNSIAGENHAFEGFKAKIPTLYINLI